jgi:DNA polymerase
VHGVPQQVTLGGNDVTLYPLYHPAAALYTRSMLSVLEEDFRRFPQLLGTAVAVVAPPPTEAEQEPEAELVAGPAVQLGLF